MLLGRKVRALEKLYDEIAAIGRAQPAIYPLDLEGATPRDYEEMATSIDREFGRLDGIVNAAEHFSGLQPAAAIEPMAWLRSLHINLSAPFLLLQACLPLLGRAQDASVVFVLDDLDRWPRALGQRCARRLRIGIDLHQEHEDGPLRVCIAAAAVRTTLRRTAYFGENSLALPLPETVADAVVYLLAADGEPARGKCWT